MPVTTFIYNALFDVHRPARTQTIIQQLRAKLDCKNGLMTIRVVSLTIPLPTADQRNESVKRELYTQELLDRALFQLPTERQQSFESGTETDGGLPAQFHATRLASRPQPKLERHTARHTTGPTHKQHERLMDELRDVSQVLLLRFSEEYDDSKLLWLLCQWGAASTQLRCCLCL